MFNVHPSMSTGAIDSNYQPVFDMKFMQSTKFSFGEILCKSSKTETISK